MYNLVLKTRVFATLNTPVAHKLITKLKNTDIQKKTKSIIKLTIYHMQGNFLILSRYMYGFDIPTYFSFCVGFIIVTYIYFTKRYRSLHSLHVLIIFLRSSNMNNATAKIVTNISVLTSERQFPKISYKSTKYFFFLSYRSCFS